MNSTRLTTDPDTTAKQDLEGSTMQRYIDEFEARQGEPPRLLCKYPKVNLDRVLEGETHTPRQKKPINVPTTPDLVE